MRIHGPWLAVAAVWLAATTSAQAQSRGYVGGAVALAGLTQPATVERVGGATWSGSVVVGASVSRRLSVEFEPTFAGNQSAENYSYRPSNSLVANVEASGRDRFFSVQLRGRAGILEPIAGVSYVRSTMRRHATFVPGGQIYFDDERSTNGIALTAGLDAAISASRRVAIVPTFRIFVVSRPSASPPANPIVGSAVVLRAGVGARVAF